MGGERAVFLDRDGVIVVPEFRNGRSYASTTLESFRIYPGITASLQALKEAGFQLIVVTNQPDVGRGVISRETMARMHERLKQTLPVDDIRTCEHTREDECDCRKPKPGMLLSAARDRGISLDQSYMVGDRDSDIEAGRRAGCRTVFIDLNYEVEAKPSSPDWCVPSLQEAAGIILAQATLKDQ